LIKIYELKLAFLKVLKKLNDISKLADIGFRELMLQITEFLNKKNEIAIIGASVKPEKWGYKVYKKLKSAGFHIYAINPKYNKINGDVCYSDLRSLPRKPDIVMTIIPPEVTEAAVKLCKELDIKRVWMQPGSESEKSIKFCKNNNIKLMHGICFVVDGLKESFDD